MKRILISLTVLALAFSGMTPAQDIFSCSDDNGKFIFTDNARNCNSSNAKEKNEVTAINVDITNVHSQYGASVSEEYYNYSFRAYEELSGYSIEIIADKGAS